MSTDANLTDVVYQMAAEGEDFAQLSLVFDDRFEVDVEINLLRLKDRQTGKEVFKHASLKYCDDRPDADARAH